MTTPQQITLTRDWGPHRAGTNLAVLARGENPRPLAVDPQRAAALLSQGIAGDFAAAAEDAPKPIPGAPRRHTAAGKGATRG